MPLYEYECQKCEKVHEIMQKFSDPLVEECPDCSSPVKKLMSLSFFALKGSGWYTTDYKRRSEPKSAGSSGGAKGEGKSEAKVDAKPEAKVETKAEAKPVATG